MDKYEYRVKTEQMQEHMEKKQYKKAMEIADTIDWRRVKNVSTLNTVSEIYEYNGEYQKSRDILFVAFDRSPGSRKIAYRLGLLALRIGDIEEAADCYEEFVKLAPKDPNQYILKYKILRAQGAPIGDQISALEDFKKAEYIEKWAYELARLYHEAGMTAECLEECDDLILWFSEGRYVYQAMELKMQYKPLTPLQQEKFDSRPGAARKARPVKKNTSAKPPVPLEEVIRGEAPVRKEVLRRVTETALRADQEALEDEEAQKESIAEEDAGTGQNTSNFGKTQSISKVVKGATLQEALANGMALANGIRSVEKTVAKVKEGIRQVTGQIHMDALVEKRGADAKKVEPAPKKEPEKVEVKEEKKEPKAAPAGAVRASRKPAPRPLDKKTDALRVTGQMRIEEILQEWEAKQKANAEAIERQREEDDERLRRERDEIGLRKELERREAEKKAAEERKALEAGATQRITPEGLQKLAEREALRKAAERKAAEEAAARKAAEEEAARKAAERKAAEEAAARKAAEEEAARKAAEEEAARKAAEEEAVRKAAEEEAARKAAKEEAARKAEEDTAKKAALKNKAVKKKVKQTTKENIAAELPEDKPVIEVGGKTQRIPDDIVRLMEELGGNSAEFGDIDIFGEPAADEKLISEIVENRYQGQDAEGDFDEGDFDEDDLDVEDYGEYELEDELGDTEDEFEEASKESDGTDDFMEDKFQEKGASEDGFEEDGTIGDFADIEDDFGEEASKESDDTDEFEEEDFDTEEDFQEDEFEEDDFGEEDTFDAEDEFEEEDFEEAEEDFEEEDFEDKVEGFEEEEYEEEDFEEEDDFAEEDDFEEEDDFAEEDDFEEEDSEEEDFEEEGFEEEEFEEEEYEEEDFDDVGDYIEDSDADYGEDDFGEEEFDEDEFEEDSEDDFEEEDFEEEDLEEDDFEEEDFDSGEFNEGDLEIEEPSEEEIQARIKKSKGKGVPFDTGFVVTGRYDLSATSEIGLKAGLTEEQKKLFSYFVPVRGMSEQLVEVLDNDRRARKEGTSKTGNLLVIGRKGSGKTVLAVDIVKAIQKQRNLKQGKVAIVTGESLNKKELTNIIQKLRGGAIIIEKAGKLNSRTIKELNHLMEKKTGELLFVLEDQRKPLERILTANPEFKKKFTSRLELPVFINDELVTFGQTYAKENGYKLDEMGILALYSRIDVMQREDHAVSVAEVKDIMDEAIEHSQKANVKHLARRVFGKSTDESDRIILKEEDFRI
ncbi:hypothetical protein [Sporofaciens musculi]|uniref:hypothetical protein n=1 Tax=Sporofaciens musculi TaxID=2681861 RepID=UPI002F42D62B